VRDTHSVLRIAVAAVLTALASPGSALAVCSGQLRPITVTSGVWSGTPWRLQAIDSGDGRFGMTVFVAGSRRARASGRLGTPERRELAWTSSRVGTRPAFVAGAVAETARTITFGLSNRTVRSVRTIPPRCLLQPDISFFVVAIPSGTQPTFFTARNAAGTIVATWRR
jgi:hypothetical protein